MPENVTAADQFAHPKTKDGCHACAGSGIYRGICEPPGVGVVCESCKGNGGFRRRKSRNIRTDIKFVRLAGSGFVLFGKTPSEGQITYQEFLAGKKPKRSQRQKK